jgi:hypothetical protein
MCATGGLDIFFVIYHVYIEQYCNILMFIIYFLAMDIIVCTAGVGNVLRTSVCISSTVLEAEVLWSGLEFVMMVAQKNVLPGAKPLSTACTSPG